MHISKREAVLSAVAYADIFDYPLTSEELRTWLPYIRHSLAISQESVLRKNTRLIAIRKQRAAWSIDKWARARRVAKLLTLIPTITIVGVTGGLTRSNAGAQDDIDFLIISAPKTLWVTRLFATILLDILHVRRRPADRHFRNLICLNMFVSEDGLAVARKERDLFTAHEVLLMTPIWERGGAYAKFLKANRWVERFLPNAWRRKAQSSKRKAQSDSAKRKTFFTSWFFAVVLRFTLYTLRSLEPPARIAQLWYMSKRRSTEIVTDKVIRFHPRDARVWIKSALGQRLSRFNIPLDKIFYGR